MNLLNWFSTISMCSLFSIGGVFPVIASVASGWQLCYISPWIIWHFVVTVVHCTDWNCHRLLALWGREILCQLNRDEWISTGCLLADLLEIYQPHDIIIDFLCCMSTGIRQVSHSKRRWIYIPWLGPKGWSPNDGLISNVHTHIRYILPQIQDDRTLPRG